MSLLSEHVGGEVGASTALKFLSGIEMADLGRNGMESI